MGPESASSSRYDGKGLATESEPTSASDGHANLDMEIQLPRTFRRASSREIDCDNILRTVFPKVFGKTSFKGKQKEIVEATLRDADVFVSAPTGMGKASV
ncbi:uncharacterized protein EI90DRAFT_3138856 [Cantharellus anzutake]|uniref:uncharacterized protein n=1 Tax=Cantharellus anzutake TaxID=1750568 RepID=UPI00190719E2|nr:uncharacterized protein EI90DRAFT_3138856 [Cantharellus anzutake]KAF8311026.1 hypothetical protein EI90DRAFT_3138856 [Cantharellus anzutake]